MFHATKIIFKKLSKSESLQKMELFMQGSESGAEKDYLNQIFKALEVWSQNLKLIRSN